MTPRIPKCNHPHHVHCKKNGVKVAIDLTYTEAQYVSSLAQKFTESGCMSEFIKTCFDEMLKQILEDEKKEATTQ